MKNDINSSTPFKTNNKSLNLVEDNMKYLYDINNTIGFRKDKKLYKFVGLRDGYDKQLELTLKSIIIDNVEKISKTRTNFTTLSMDDQTGIKHELNNNLFLNILTDNNYKNLLVINDLFTSIDIIYEIHTKGIKVKNNCIDNIYEHNYDYTFTFCDYNEYDKFIINSPLVFDSNGNSYSFVKHSLYMDNDKLMYKKSIIKNKIKSYYPLYIDISINFNIPLPSLTQNELNDNKIYGQTIKYVEPNEKFTLSAYTNVPLNSYNIITWTDNINNLNIIGTGTTILLNSSCYKDGDLIYANVINSTDPNSGYSMCLNPLIVKLSLNTKYEQIPIKNDNIIPSDIDSVYWKFHRCISGVCFMYIRDTSNIYEQNELVCDTSLTGSYNMYSEYDIIDEFFANSHEVEIAVNYNVDLTKVYKQLDNVFLHIGTRLLLFNQINILENGIYLVDEYYKLVKTDELKDIESLFRYKVHVNAGTYFDKEFHVNGYYLV